MKIQGFQNIPSVLQTIKTEVSESGAVSNSTSSSSVTLSSFAETFQTIQRLSAQTTQARQEKIGELTAQEQAGKLTPDLGKIAEKLQELNVVDLGL